MSIVYENFFSAMGLPMVEKSASRERFEELLAQWDGKLPYFLEESFFLELYPFLKAPFSQEEMLSYLRDIRTIAGEHEEVAFLGYLLYKLAYEDQQPISCKLEGDPITFLGEKYTGMFAVLLSLGVYPFMVKAHKTLGLPEHYAKDALAWIGGTMLAYSVAHPGIPGRPLELSWLVKHINKTLFRIGRFEYLLHSVPEWLSAIYQNPAGEIKVLCRENWKFRKDKIRAGAGEEVAYTAFLEETSQSIRGIGCDPYGIPDFENPVTLDKSQWQSLLTPWTLCPSIHIPAGGKMPFEEVVASMKEAKEFFQRYFKKHVPLFCCCSWILNPAWESLMANSNMARFRKECYAVPSPSWGNRAGVGFIFGRNDKDPRELPATNTVQRALQEATEKGMMGAGAIFVLTEDLDKLGNEYYRKKYGAFPGKE